MGKDKFQALSRRLQIPLFALLLVMAARTDVLAAPHSVIFVVDASEKMANHLGDVKDTILSYVEQSERGDYLGVISFSSTAMSLASKKISGPTDRKSLEVMLEALTARGDIGNIDRGMERALEEVANLKRKGDKNVKGIIIISASALPAERPIDDLDKLTEDIAKQVSPNEWYIQYCYLAGARDDVIANFVSDNDGLSYDIDALKDANKSETLAELYKIALIPEEFCRPITADLQGAILIKPPAAAEWVALKKGESIEEGAQVNVAEESRLALAINSFGRIGLAPGAEIVVKRARRNPVSGQFEIIIGLETGAMWINMDDKVAGIHLNYKGNETEIGGRAACLARADTSGDIELISFSGGLTVKPDNASKEPLVIEPNHRAFITAGRVLNPPQPAEPKFAEEWKRWSMILSKGISLNTVEFAIPEIAFEAGEFLLGPLQSGRVLSQKLPLHLKNVPKGAKLEVDVEVSVPLPDGISVTTAVVDGEKPDRKDLLLKLDGSGGFSSGRKEEHKGFLRLLPAPTSAVNFQIVSIPLTIVTKKSFLSRGILLFGLLALALGAAGFASTRLYRKKDTVRPRPYRAIGRLIVIDDPTKGRIGSINLEEISTKSSRLSLVIGREKTTEIRLKHTSVQPNHCLLEAHLVGDHLVTYIEPLASGTVLIDNTKISSKARLEDGAKIAIGDFSFQFEDTQFYKKVDIVYSNGRRISGILDASGMDADGFKISPMDAVSPSERARVKFSEIRSVTFHRRTTDILAQKPRPPKQAGMKHVELMFKRGDTIAGYIQREYSEGRQRFVELLPLDQNSDIDYTIVEYSSVVEKKVL